MAKHKFPKELVVFVSDHLDNNEVLYGATVGLGDLPDDSDREFVAIYELKTTRLFKITRELV